MTQKATTETITPIVRPEIEGIIEIPQCGLYAKSEEALKNLFEWLNQYYDIKNSSDEPDKPAQSWYARVKPTVVRLCAKCNFCGAYIERSGIANHGHCCEACGQVVMEEFVNGGTVRFRFYRTEESDEVAPELSLKVFGYDLETNSLLLYPTPLKDSYLFAATPEQAQAELDLQADKWRWVERDGQKLIAILKRRGVFKDDDSPINLADIRGKREYYSYVKLFQDQEFSGFFSNPPIVESYAIDEAWHWAPLQPSPKLHESIIHAARMVSRCDYYYQDGRPAFGSTALMRMRIFVEHFTALDLKAWDHMIARASLSGPGMIKAIAAFCHPNAQVRNEPNIGNLLVVVDKIGSGGIGNCTQGEIDAASLAWNDPETRERFVDTMSSKGNLWRRIKKG